MSDALEQPRPLVAGDAVGLLHGGGMFWVPVRFSHIDARGWHVFAPCGTVEFQPTQVLDVARYGLEWRFADEPQVTFEAACPDCAAITWEERTQCIAEKGYAPRKPQAPECTTCHGTRWVPFDAFPELSLTFAGVL